MDIEMRLIPRLEQTVYLIPEYEIGRVLSTASPFHGNFPAKDDLIAYLIKVNGALKEQRDERTTLYRQYITAASIHACMSPIVHLGLPEKLTTSFIIIAERKPYRVHAPREIVLTKNEEDAEPRIIESLLHAQFADIEENVPRNLETTFTASEFVKYKLARGLKDTANRLQREYREHDHLIFTSIKDICLPLLGAGQKGRKYREEYHDLSVHLQHHYGHLHLKVPLCLAPERRDVA